MLYFTFPILSPLQNTLQFKTMACPHPLILLLLLVPVCLPHKCVHSKKMQSFTPHKLQLPRSDRSYIQSNSTYLHMKITHTYLPLDSPTSPAVDQYIVKTIKIASAYFNKALQVLSAPIYAPANIAKCYEVDILNEHRQPFNSDLHLYVTSQKSPNQSFLAWAAPCIINNIGRPIFGQVNYNTYYLQINRTNYGYQKDIQTIVHQIIHVLAFSPALYGFFKQKPSIVKQYGMTLLRTPTLINWMKEHFNCAIGAPLEDEGSEGSVGAHWERSVFQDEIMTASDMTTRLAFSNATLALLVSSGWYKVDYALSEAFIYGKGAGCTFLATLCRGQFPEYCYSPNQVSCTFDHSAIAYCNYDHYSNKCEYFSAYKNTVCADDSIYGSPSIGTQYAYDSRCFKSTFVMTANSNLNFRCYRAKCIQGSILIRVSGKQYLCQRPGQMLNATPPMKGILQCPYTDFSLFCAAEKYCDGFCNQQGYCLNGHCICRQGRYGVNCQSQCDTSRYYIYQGSCVDYCPMKTFTYEKTRTCLSGCPNSTYVMNGSVCVDCGRYCKECSGIDCRLCESGARLVQGKCEPIHALSSYKEQLVISLVMVLICIIL